MADLTVVYEAGVFRPVTPLAFAEGQRLQIRILDLATLPLPLMEALNPLILSGALTLPPRRVAGLLPEVIFSDDLNDQYESYGIDRPSQNLLSDSIIDDRGPW
jgi:hypothetical protein